MLSVFVKEGGGKRDIRYRRRDCDQKMKKKIDKKKQQHKLQFDCLTFRLRQKYYGPRYYSIR